jgi:hypothetical protein
VANIAEPQFGGSARGAALGLSLVDGRFASDPLGPELTRAVAAWPGAVDGDRGVRESTDATEFREHWRLALDGDDGHPWRIVEAT